MMIISCRGLIHTRKPSRTGFMRCSAPPVFHAPVHEVGRADTSVRDDSDANAIFYLNRSVVPVIGSES